MVERESLIRQIIDAAQSRGMNQKALAKRAGVSAETLSRAKQRETANLGLIEALARAAGVSIGLIGSIPAAPGRDRNSSFRDRHRALAWSNPGASNDVLLRRALVMPEFQTLLDAVLEFGMERVSGEWDQIKASDDPEVQRAMPVTDRVLRNIRNGYEQATA